MLGQIITYLTHGNTQPYLENQSHYGVWIKNNYMTTISRTILSQFKQKQKYLELFLQVQNIAAHDLLNRI